MGPQSLVDPMLFLALTPTILFIALIILFTRWRKIAGTLIQRRVRANRQSGKAR